MFVTAPVLGAVDLSRLRPVPVLDAGRVKPIDTVAREAVRQMTGRERFRDAAVAGGAWDPLALCLAIAREPEVWAGKPVVHVPYIELRTLLGLPEATQHVDARSLRANAEVRKIVEGALAKRREAAAHNEDPRLTRLETVALELSDRLAVFDEIATGRRFALVPGDRAEAPWSSPPDLPTDHPMRTVWKGVLSADTDAALASATGDLWKSAIAFSPRGAVDEADLRREVAYHQLHPFRWAWMVYLVSLAVLCVSLITPGRWVYRAGMALLGLGIVWSCVAFAWRCSITGWAPVTNLYETVIWVALVGAITAVGIELLSGRSASGTAAVRAGPPTIPAIAGATSATLAGIVADVMPPEYGAAVRNLAPVLRSNLWLTVHVLTIVSSYAAFLVALVLGNLVLFQFAFGRGSGAGRDLNLKYIYRATQVGVLLVAAGTILGALWADVSWGRFWGWDPKEVWALIILLVYLALLHGRFAGWVKPFGLAAGSVLCFLTVLMSWYGVNFVLGAGLHTYGFNTGGQGYVMAFTGLQLGFLGVCWAVYRRRRGEPGEAAGTKPEPIGTLR